MNKTWLITKSIGQKQIYPSNKADGLLTCFLFLALLRFPESDFSLGVSCVCVE